VELSEALSSDWLPFYLQPKAKELEAISEAAPVDPIPGNLL
jgi:hypothetical protein